MPEALRLPGYSANYVTYLSTALPTRKVAGIEVPSSPLITAALDLARDRLEESMYRHTFRSWILGTALADRTPSLANRDRELHSIALILHDMGCDKDERSSPDDKAFEVDRANAVKAFIEREANALDWDQNRTQLLLDAVALQTSTSIATHKRAEVVATALGIVTDFGGPNAAPGNVLTVAEWQRLNFEFPRIGLLNNGIVQRKCAFCRKKPETIYNDLVGDFGEELVEGYSRIGNRWYDFITNPIDAD